ncbi:MAG: D-alanine--D-alanine ligase [Kiritimatiellia bacterium]
MGLKIGMTYDLRSDYLREGFTEDQVAEFDSDATIDAIESTLRELGHQPVRIGHGRALCARLAAGDRWELVFNIAEGVSGRSREAQVPAMLELYSIPYVMSDPLVCCVTLDKAMTKRLVHASGINTPAYRLVANLHEAEQVDLKYPLFAKPVAEGTGKGVDGLSRVDNPARLHDLCKALLHKYRQPVLVEEYLPGREFTTGILGTGPHARVLGTMEVTIAPHAPSRDYTYEIKEKCEELVVYRPLEHGALRVEVEELALKAYRVLECRDTGRVDVRVDASGRPAFIEINPLPGLHPHHSDLPMIATQEGMSYRDLIDHIVRSAALRAGLEV